MNLINPEAKIKRKLKRMCSKLRSRENSSLPLVYRSSQYATSAIAAVQECSRNSIREGLLLLYASLSIVVVGIPTWVRSTVLILIVGETCLIRCMTERHIYPYKVIDLLCRSTQKSCEALKTSNIQLARTVIRQPVNSTQLDHTHTWSMPVPYILYSTQTTLSIHKPRSTVKQ
ncbi:hypothetical protein F4859DRAFT_311391 [Xylaria cf. heliscus]|nr:hypothetical protein F4859DRAFT_311391 [Xylaria cf. heliscus]